MVRFRDVQLSNLQLRGLTYYLRRKVPLELREIIGPRELVESLATEDRTEVKARLSARLVEIAGGWLRPAGSSSRPPLIPKLQLLPGCRPPLMPIIMPSAFTGDLRPPSKE